MSSADNLCKHFGPRTGPTTFCRAWSGSNLFDVLKVFLNDFFEKVDFEKNQQTTKKHEILPSRQRGNVPPIICTRQNLGENKFWVSKSLRFHGNHLLWRMIHNKIQAHIELQVQTNYKSTTNYKTTTNYKLIINYKPIKLRNTSQVGRLLQ